MRHDFGRAIISFAIVVLHWFCYNEFNELSRPNFIFERMFLVDVFNSIISAILQLFLFALVPFMWRLATARKRESFLIGLG